MGCVSDGGACRGGRWLRESHPRVGRGPRQQQLPHSGGTKTKQAPSTPSVKATQPAIGEMCTSPPESSSQCTPLSFSLPGAVCSAKQNNVKQGLNHPGLTAFTCDPNSLDDAVTGWGKKIRLLTIKSIIHKYRQTGALIISWKRWGHCSA